ncbi:MAG: AAA family ATPase [Corynebacterium sp.]|uniref:HelD family protein n=1 Tax=Corynebacterium sp. TaxID=1720 RepID=UPI0026DBF0E3|nr:UvrD-helicase domain-containing protein [Corynebacterium sp.]MDO4761269.1 AAA family ATPase [Corynebacterium sp.]
MLNKDQIAAEIAREQSYVDGLFSRLDREVSQAQERLAQVQLRVDPSNPDAEALVDRETEYHGLHDRIDRLNIAQLGLVFGRIDVTVDNPSLIDNPVAENVDRRYIGRMGLDDREDDYRTLLVDWRAPMARPFYLATTAQPEGVLVRRHIRTKGRTVVGVDDEVLSGELAADELREESTGGHEARLGVASESALHRALHKARTGRMASIVETIQREQDEIIRDETRGVMVVEGGPGTGKTAVALHRVAYLLYTWREQLARTGVLIIGPNRTFLDYISRVLPELGETGVVLTTVGEMFPGVVPAHSESLLAREIKGSVEMVTILDRAVKSYQSLPDSPRVVTIEGIELLVDAATIKAARTRARRARRPHNVAQPLFAEALAEQLTIQMVEKIGADPLGGKNLLGLGDRAQLHDDIQEDPVTHALVQEFWPLLHPAQVLAELVESPERIAEVAFDYDEETQSALARECGTAWTASDAALVDEIAHLIGVDEQEDSLSAWSAEFSAAEETLEGLSSSASSDLDDELDAEVLSAFDVIDASELAQRQVVSDSRSTAQRALADLQWAYGHVIIDEAQELSPMEWRMVMRRVPNRWMTIVGDTSQTSSPAGVDSWADTLAPFVSQRFKKHQLTINYRTPEEIMAVANDVLAVFAPDVVPSVSLRRSHHPVEFSSEDPLVLAQRLREQDPQRLTAVIAAESAPGVLGVEEIKGLEFDHVVVVDPVRIVEASPQGYQDLFVALTRATQTLTIVGDLEQVIAPRN